MRASLLRRTALLAAIFVAAGSFAFAQDTFNYGGGAVDLLAFDDLYDGSLASMACVALDNNAGTIGNITVGPAYHSGRSLRLAS